MSFPFNILAPITLGRKGDKGDKGDPPTSMPWSSVTEKPSAFPPESHAHAITDITGLQAALNGKANIPTGPWENDFIAAGCPYATLHGHLFVYGVPGVLEEEEISIGLNPAVSPNFTPRVESVAGGSIVYYTPDESTYQDIIDLLEADSSVVKPQFPDWLLSQTVPEFDNTLSVFFANGSATPRVSVGSLYYTANGSVKRRMS
jgi:hypothetical protein